MARHKFQKGEITNPKGRPSCPLSASAFSLAMKEEFRNAVRGIVDMDKLVKVVYDLAVEDKNLIAAQLLFDRILGKTPVAKDEDDAQSTSQPTITISLTDAHKIAEAHNASRQP
jgi:hypothetical protein